MKGSGFRVQGSGFRVQGSGFQVQGDGFGYRGTSLIRNHSPLGPYSRIMPRALMESQGGGLMSEVPLYGFKT